MNLDPARRWCYILSMVFCTPAYNRKQFTIRDSKNWLINELPNTTSCPLTFDEAHSYRAHFGKFIDRFKSMIDWLRQKLKKRPNKRVQYEWLKRAITHPKFFRRKTKDIHPLSFSYLCNKSLVSVAYLCEFLVVEDLERASRWDFANGGRVKTMVIIAVSWLDKNGRIR